MVMTFEEMFEGLPDFIKPLFEKHEEFNVFGTTFNYFVKIDGVVLDHPPRKWCNENFGPQEEEWFFLAGGYWCFKTKEDAIAFKLRWL